MTIFPGRFAGRAAIVVANVTAFAEGLDVSADDVMLHVALRAPSGTNIKVDGVDVGRQQGGHEVADGGVADADGVRVGYYPDCGGVAGELGEEGGEALGDFVGGVHGVEVLEGLGGKRVSLCFGGFVFCA